MKPMQIRNAWCLISTTLLKTSSWTTLYLPTPTWLQLPAGDDGDTAGNLDAVGERVAPEVVVDEGGHHSHLGQPQPQWDVLNPVLHEERHCVSLS